MTIKLIIRNKRTGKNRKLTGKNRKLTGKNRKRTGKNRKRTGKRQKGGNALNNLLDNVPFGESLNSSIHALGNGVSNTLNMYKGLPLSPSSTVTDQLLLNNK
jgi:hypothetical protein